MSKNMRLSTCLCHPKKNPSISKQLAFLSFASKRRQNLSLQRSRSMLELLALNWFDVLVSVIIYVCGINSTFLINWIMDFSLNLPPVLSPIALTQSQFYSHVHTAYNELNEFRWQFILEPHTWLMYVWNRNYRTHKHDYFVVLFGMFVEIVCVLCVAQLKASNGY